MAYNTEDLLKKAMRFIEQKKLVFHADVHGLLKISTSTYYEHFPKESKYYNKIDEALTENKVNIKAAIRNKWFKSRSDTGSLYLYKLLGDPDERRKLSINYNEQVNPIEYTHRINTDDLDEETLLKLKKAYENRNSPDTDRE